MIVCRSRDEIDKIDSSCRLVRTILGELEALVRPGVTTRELDEIVNMSLEARMLPIPELFDEIMKLGLHYTIARELVLVSSNPEFKMRAVRSDEDQQGDVDAEVF